MIGVLLSVALAQILPAQTTAGITSVADPYTGGTTLAPGGLALIQGPFLGQNPRVTVGNSVAWVVTPPFLSNGLRMIVQIPVDVQPGTANVVVNVNSGSTPSFPITIANYAPALLAATSGSVFSPAHASGIPVTANTPAAPGEIVTIAATGLGPTNPAVATGTAAPAGAVTIATPTVTMGSNAISSATASLLTGQIGVYQVSFAVPQGTAPGSYPVTVTIGGVASNSITLNVGTAPAGPAIATIVDAESSSAALCPGDLAAIYGINFGASPSVSVAGKAAYIISPSVNGGPMIVQIPVDAPSGSSISPNPIAITVASSGQTSQPFNVSLGAVAPALFGTPVHSSSGAAVTAANPALPNETVWIEAIGLGATNPPVATGGLPPSGGAQVVNEPTVTIAGSPPLTGAATLDLAQIGVYRIAFTIPANPPTGNSVLIKVLAGPSGNQAISNNLLTIAVALSEAAPTITGLDNIYSYIQPGMPGYGIAQGSIFAIFGSNLSQGTSNGLQPVPLPLKLQQATVSITVNGVTTQGIFYYASPSQIVAILPSATPVGDGTVTVNNGFASVSAPIHVVMSAPGIITRNAGGTGPASAFDLSFNPLGFTNALNAGDYFVLWGTGVGPVSGDETMTQTAANLTSVPMTIEVGGVQAQLVYRGRSTFPGLDQIIGIVPQGVTSGCWVSVDARVNNIVSNFATLPIADSGRVCADASMGITTDIAQKIAGMTSFNAGFLDIEKNVYVQANGSGYSVAYNDIVSAQFMKINTSDFAAFTLGPSIGSCLVSNSYNAGAPWGTLTSSALDAGSALNVTGAGGQTTVSYQSSVASWLGTGGLYLSPPGLTPWQGSAGAYVGFVGGGFPQGSLPPFLSNQGGGSVTFQNGAGGANVAGFNASVPFLTSLMNWSQLQTLAGKSVSLSGGFTVTWSNADPNSFILISGRTNAQGSVPVAEFTCAAPAAAGQFAIPESVRLSLPSATTIAANPAFTPILEVTEMGFPQTFTAPGIDFGFAQASVPQSEGVFYGQ